MLISELFEDSLNPCNEGRILRGEITAIDNKIYNYNNKEEL